MSRTDVFHGRVALRVLPATDDAHARWRLVLADNEVARPGARHAAIIVRRSNVFYDAETAFDFTVDPSTGQSAFSWSQSSSFPHDSERVDTLLV